MFWNYLGFRDYFKSQVISLRIYNYLQMIAENLVTDLIISYAGCAFSAMICILKFNNFLVSMGITDHIYGKMKEFTNVTSYE